jgi:hypothetical protein
MLPYYHNEDASVLYCERCEHNGVSAIVFCDLCPATCCIHLSGKVDNKLWCIRCIENTGLDPTILFRWFWSVG